jgi:hypothetical protein
MSTTSHNAEPAIATEEVEQIADQIAKKIAGAKPGDVVVLTLDSPFECKNKNEKGECACELDEDSLADVCSVIHEKIGTHFNDMLTTSLAVILAKKFGLLDDAEFKAYDEHAVAYSKWLLKLVAKCEEKMPKNSKSE